MKLYLLFAISLTVTAREVYPPTYQHCDPVTSEVYLCEQCPPGTAVHQHCGRDAPTVCVPCPEGHFSDHWHWGSACRPCTSICKEKQLVLKECNQTHDRLCSCAQGYHLEVEFCVKHTVCPPGFGAVKLGSPKRDTECKRCAKGYFSSTFSASEPCFPHKDCSILGMKTVRPGTAEKDSVCEKKGGSLAPECFQHHSQCHPGVSQCERTVAQRPGLRTLTLSDLRLVTDSLPGVKVNEEAIQAVVDSCQSQQYLLKLLHLWKAQNGEQDLARGLAHSLRELRTKGASRQLLRNMRRLSMIFSASSIRKLYKKIFLRLMLDKCFKSKS